MDGQPLSLWYRQTQKPGKYFLSYQVFAVSLLLLVMLLNENTQYFWWHYLYMTHAKFC
jgi:hypothetical protein